MREVGKLPKRPNLKAVHTEQPVTESESKVANAQVQKDIEFAATLTNENLTKFFKVQTIKLAQTKEICSILAAEIKKRGLS
jgi:uncharacterized protein YehS (DUF1456 family)